MKNLRTALAACLILAAPSTAQPPATTQQRGPEPALRDMKSLDDLRQAFNHDAGKVRLVLLLSPT